ncbi:hypothetical protein ARMSODRAFT_1016601 [Armillaria solidipes]|uniref:Uncharacterized protein n=1 Tax=Armillaria solidipes TaxID=1076256 RepID=A0A2H3BL32_9AGAR|nr:hypothetical protein ARMSODRAFT_1016601 [Armillaria solidipes]
MPDISPLASDIINKIPDLLHKLDRYLDQNRRLVVQCDNLEAEIALVAARLDTQRQIRQRMHSVKKPEVDFTREENPIQKNEEDIEQTQTNKENDALAMARTPKASADKKGKEWDIGASLRDGQPRTGTSGTSGEEAMPPSRF